MTGRAMMYPILWLAGSVGVIASAPGGSVDPTPTQVVDTVFRHALHSNFSCLDCHTMQTTHGELLVRDVVDCRGCHHTGDRLELGCTSCHAPEDVADVAGSVRATFAFSVHEGAQVREVDFDHGLHADRECVECHQGGPSLTPRGLDCDACHAEHHEPDNRACMTCHRPAPPGAHTLAVHTSCSGAGCHVDPPFASSPRTRVGCLWCHDDREDHEPRGVCTDCHFVSQPLHSHGRTPYR